MHYSLRGKRVWVAGHRGMVGSALVRRLKCEDCEIITAPRSELDLLDQMAVERWLIKNKPDVVIIAAAKVGGINANNKFPVDFLYQNLMIELNVIHGAFKAEVERVLFLGSSCIYPKLASQPIKENSLLTGPLEPTNEWYAIAKIAGIKLVKAYRLQYGLDWISAMPTNLYGPGDNYDLDNSHVLPAMLRKFHEAKVNNEQFVTLWGTGKPMREFMHSDDLADALVFILSNYSDECHINIGSGEEISINDLAEMVREIVGFPGLIQWNANMPDGTPRKLMDSTKLHQLGWRQNVSLYEGIKGVYRSHFLT